MRADLRDRVIVNGMARDGQYRWKITTGHRPTAEAVAVDLGASLTARDAYWEIVSPGSLLRVHVAADPVGGLVVSFAAALAVGFALAVPSWQAPHIYTPAVWALLREHTGSALQGELTVCPVDVATRGGRLVRYGLPRLTLPVVAAI